MKGCILPFPKKCDLGLAKNHRGITLTSIAAKIYNALIRNRIELKIDNILTKNQNGFRKNRSITPQILTIRRILEGVRQKTYRRQYYLSTLPRTLIPYTERKWHHLYGHLPPITKTIKVRRTRHAGYCWRSSDELISDVLLWTPSHGRAKAGRPARTYIEELREDTGCIPEDLSEAMNDREERWDRIRDIRAGGMTWIWW